jgi:hypothetical protein
MTAKKTKKTKKDEKTEAAPVEAVLADEPKAAEKPLSIKEQITAQRALTIKAKEKADAKAAAEAAEAKRERREALGLSNEVEEPAPAASGTLEERVEKLERMVQKKLAPIARYVETKWQLDFDRDGKVGGVRLGVVALMLTFGVIYGLCSLLISADPPAGAIQAYRDDVYFTSAGLFVPNLTASGAITNGGDLNVTGIVYAEHFDSSDDAVIDDNLLVSGTATLTEQSVHSGGLNVDEDIDIDFDANDEEITIDQATNSYASGGSIIRVFSAEDANGDNQQYQLRLAYANDAGANNEFIICQDNSDGTAANGDAKFTVAEEGNTTIAGTLSVDGATDLDDLDIDIASELNIDGELVCIGATGDGDTADGDNDLVVKGDAEVDGTLRVDTLLDINEDIDIDLDAGDEEIHIRQSTNAYGSGQAVMTIQSSEDADGDSQMYLLKLEYNNNGGANNEYITCLDNAYGDAKFVVAEEGNTTIAGTLGVTGLSTLTGGATVREDVAVRLDAADEEVSIETSTNTLASGTALVRIRSTEDANGDNQQYLLDLAYTNDGGANNEYLICRDNAFGDTKFAIAEEGNTTIAGTLSVDGAFTLGGDLTGSTSGLNVSNTTIAGTLIVTGATTVAAISTGTSEATVDGKYAVVGPDASTGLMVWGWTNTIASGSHTQLFDTAFGATPISVVVSYAAALTGTSLTNNGIWSAQSTWNTTQCVVVGRADLLYSGCVIGARP